MNDKTVRYSANRTCSLFNWLYNSFKKYPKDLKLNGLYNHLNLNNISLWVCMSIQSDLQTSHLMYVRKICLHAFYCSVWRQKNTLSSDTLFIYFVVNFLWNCSFSSAYFCWSSISLKKNNKKTAEPWSQRCLASEI